MYNYIVKSLINTATKKTALNRQRAKPHADDTRDQFETSWTFAVVFRAFRRQTRTAPPNLQNRRAALNRGRESQRFFFFFTYPNQVNRIFSTESQKITETSELIDRVQSRVDEKILTRVILVNFFEQNGKNQYRAHCSHIRPVPDSGNEIRMNVLCPIETIRKRKITFVWFFFFLLVIIEEQTSRVWSRRKKYIVSKRSDRSEEQNRLEFRLFNSLMRPGVASLLTRRFLSPARTRFR